MRKGKLLGILFFVGIAGWLHAEKTIQCIANFEIHSELYTQALQKRGYNAKVVPVDIKEYEDQLLVRKGRFHALLRKLHLDFPRKVDVPEEVEKIVFFNVTPKMIKKYDLSRFPKEKLILFMWEPKTVLEGMYTFPIQNCFSKIYTWDDSLVDNATYFKFHYPVFTPQIPELPSFESKKLCTLIASHLTAATENELYSQRIEAIRYFENAGEEGFEFYGRRWDPAQYKSYRGTIPEKLTVLQNYRFCICYENTCNVSGYVTEKIFDCFAAGVVPIYWGAANIEEYIPKDCYIDRRDFKTLEELHHFLRSMPKSIYQDYQKGIRVFLQSEGAKKFHFDSLAEVFYQACNAN